jgi:hypothetical protein
MCNSLSTDHITSRRPMPEYYLKIVAHSTFAKEKDLSQHNHKISGVVSVIMSKALLE